MFLKKYHQLELPSGERLAVGGPQDEEFLQALVGERIDLVKTDELGEKQPSEGKLYAANSANRAAIFWQGPDGKRQETRFRVQMVAGGAVICEADPSISNVLGGLGREVIELIEREWGDDRPMTPERGGRIAHEVFLIFKNYLGEAGANSVPREGKILAMLQSIGIMNDCGREDEERIEKRGVILMRLLIASAVLGVLNSIA